MFGKVYCYNVELNFGLDEVRLAFPELTDAFKDSVYFTVKSKFFDDPDEAMEALNEDAHKRFVRLCTVNPEHKYERVMKRNPLMEGATVEELSDSDRTFWEPNKLSLMVAVREDSNEFMYRYTFYAGAQSARAAMLQENLKGLPVATQLAFINNFTTTLQ